MHVDDAQTEREEALERLRRSSELSIDRDGTFLYRGEPLQNPRVAALFHAGVAVREDGEVTLTVGRWWCYVEVHSVAHFVERLGGRGEGGVGTALVRGKGELSLDGAILAYGSDVDRFVLWLRGLGGPALLLRAAHERALAALMQDGETWLDGGAEGEVWLPSLGLTCLKIDELPRPAAPRPA